MSSCVIFGRRLRRSAGLRAAGALDVLGSVRFGAMVQSLRCRNRTEGTNTSSLRPAAECSSESALAAHDPRIDEEIVDLPRPARREGRELDPEVGGTDRQRQDRGDLARRLPRRKEDRILIAEAEEAAKDK